MLRSLYCLCQTNIVVVLIGILISSGCSDSKATSIPSPIFIPLAEQIDKSPFTGVPCAAPCWQGLEVGKSSERDVIVVLSKLTFINQETVQTYHVSMPNIDYSASAQGILIEANCANPGQQCLSLSVIDNVLTRIVIGLNYEIRPNEAIDYLGKPDYVGYDDFSAEKIMCEVYLVWKSSRLVLATKLGDSAGAEKYCYVVRSEGKVPASLQISEARFLSDAELNNYLGTGTGKFFEFMGTIP